MRRTTTSVSTPAKKARVNGVKKTPAQKRAKTAVTGLVKIPGRQLPLRLQNKMRFSKVVEIAVVAGAGSYGFSVNGLFNPDVTVTGTRPLYFVELMDLYTHYSVQSSKLSVQTLTTTNAYSLILSIDDDNIGSTAQRMLMQGNTANTVITPGGPSIKKTISWNRGANYGVGAMEGASLTGSSGLNPTEQQFYRVNVDDPNLGIFTVFAQVMWEADVIFNELKTVAGTG